MSGERRYLSHPGNRAIAAALLVAIDALTPDHPAFAYWHEYRALLAILVEVS
jgi:hypothetical protein